MAAKSAIDRFANVAAILVAEAVAGTMATAKFAFPFSIMDKVALVLSRIEYHFADPGLLNSSGDYVVIALTASSTPADLAAQNDPLVIDNCTMHRVDYGTAASGNMFIKPHVKDFSSLPSGGILVAPSPLYAAIKSTGASGVCAAWLKLYYTYLEMAADEYWQLVESRRIIST